MAKHIKITSILGVISFVVFNEDLYNRLNKQNEGVAPERKSKIETVDITNEEIQSQNGFDENAALALNPTASKLIQESEAKDSRIADLEKQLAELKAPTSEIKESKTKK